MDQAHMVITNCDKYNTPAASNGCVARVGWRVLVDAARPFSFLLGEADGCRARIVCAVSAVLPGTALERRGTLTDAPGWSPLGEAIQGDAATAGARWPGSPRFAKTKQFDTSLRRNGFFQAASAGRCRVTV
jgi:hypothetical protein